jgi:hypothetical protein
VDLRGVSPSQAKKQTEKGEKRKREHEESVQFVFTVEIQVPSVKRRHDVYGVYILGVSVRRRGVVIGSGSKQSRREE